MLRLRHHKVPADSLLSSSLFDEQTFYKAFIKDLNNCREEVIIESPYMTVTRLTMLVPTLRSLTRKGVRVRVNTRFPGHHDELLRIQAWKATKLLNQTGVKVHFFNNYHHRKIAVLDQKVLWEGSLNILSQNNSREIMRRIESEQLARQMIQFLRLNRWYW